MKRILFITGIQIFPAQSGGQMRSGNLAKSLARAGHDVFIYSYTGRKPEYLARAPSSLRVIEPGLSEYVDRSWLNGLIQFLTYRLKLPNLWFLLPFRFLSFPRLLKQKMEAADLVVIDVPYHFPVLRFAGARPKILSSHNLEQSLERRPLVRALVAWAERRAARAVDVVLSCGKEDREFYRSQRPGLQVVEIPNALDLKGYEFGSVPARLAARKALGVTLGTRLLVFMGSKWGPNHRGLEFLKRFEKQHRARLAELRVVLLVVGSVSETPLREGRLIATGFVPDTTLFFHAADYALNPVSEGSGTNVKMFEYLAHRLPILSTAFGARGFDLVPGEDYFAFEEGNLMEVLETLCRGSWESHQRLGEGAYWKSRSSCDMDSVVKERVMPVVSKLTIVRAPKPDAPDFSPTPPGSAFPGLSLGRLRGFVDRLPGGS